MKFTTWILAKENQKEKFKNMLYLDLVKYCNKVKLIPPTPLEYDLFIGIENEVKEELEELEVENEVKEELEELEVENEVKEELEEAAEVEKEVEKFKKTRKKKMRPKEE